MRPAQEAQANREGQHEMASLSQAIQWCHKAIQDLSDAEAKSQVSAALNTLTSVQARAHKPFAGAGRQQQ